MFHEYKLNNFTSTFVNEIIYAFAYYYYVLYIKKIIVTHSNIPNATSHHICAQSLNKHKSNNNYITLCIITILKFSHDTVF